MSAVVNAAIRWGIVVIMGIATFLPDWGIVALSIKFFAGIPFVITILDLFWVIALALVLPFTLRLFRWITTIAITAISALSVYLLWRDVPLVFDAWPWYMWAVVVAFVAVGWLLVSTPLWRWTKGAMPVAQTDHTTVTTTHHN